MRIVYFGTSDFAVPALEAVADHVLLVVSQPDRPSGRGLELRPSPVKRRALELGLDVATPAKCRAPEFVESVRAIDADVLLVAAYGQILSVPLLETAHQGGVNLHGSILPKYRGAAPIQRCLLNGDSETGVTLMQMAAGMDTGDIIAVERTMIGPEETAGELLVRLAALAGDMARKWIPVVCSGDYPRAPQDDSQATMAPKVAKSEAELRFDRDMAAEFDRYRAFTPSPGAFVRTRLGVLKLNKAVARPDRRPGAGRVESVRPQLVVGFENGSLVLSEVQPEGKKRMSGADWANGARLAVADCLLP